MPPTVDVCISYYGDKAIWEPLAKRAKASAVAQTVQPYTVFTTYFEEGPLSRARNVCAARSSADWLIFLDADDELDPGYVEAMLAGEGDLRWPSTLGVVEGREDDYPVLLQPKQNLLWGNHMVIGSMVRRRIFEQVGGFRDLPCLEDWDCWIRCVIAGAQTAPCPEAIYRVHVQPNSRNKDETLHGLTYAQIQQAYAGRLP